MDFNSLKDKKDVPQLPFMDTSVLVFCQYLIQAPAALCFSWLLTTVNAQLVFECQMRPLSLCLPCLWVFFCLCSCFKWFKAPKELTHEATPKKSKGISAIEVQKRPQFGIQGVDFQDMSFTFFFLTASRMHELKGAQWAGMPSLTLVVQKMSHASSQS